VGKLASLQLSD